MENHHTLSVFREKYSRLTKPEFLETFKTPFLVVELKVYAPNSGQINTRSPSQSVKNSGDNLLNSAIVVQIANPEKSPVTLGRLPTSDICVDHPSVSKIHAWLFHAGPGGKMSVKDAGSRFGTALNGLTLEKDQEQAIESGDTLVLARSVTATYFNAHDFFEYLRITGKCLSCGS